MPGFAVCLLADLNEFSSSCAGFREMPGQASNGSELKQVSERNVGGERLLQMRMQHDDEQRITADVEEIVVQPDAGDL